MRSTIVWFQAHLATILRRSLLRLPMTTDTVLATTSVTIASTQALPQTESSSFRRSAHKKLAEVEGRIFASSGVNILSKFVPLSFKKSEVYTVTAECPTSSKDNSPVVLLHGFAAGVALWSGNIADIAKHHTVHAVDLLGFGRSSRPNFSGDAKKAENEMVEAIDEWRQKMGISKMKLVAHSFGGYLASSYALRYPEAVEQLVLVDAWGFSERSEEYIQKLNPPRWIMVASHVLTKVNPLAVLRLAGPWGPSLIRRLRPDLGLRYPSENADDIFEYIYRCNSRSPTGEAAFRNMNISLGFAKHPMEPRFAGLRSDVPVTFVFGDRTWIDPQPAMRIQKQRPDIDIHFVHNSGHHVYADNRESFNELLTWLVSDRAGKQPTLVSTYYRRGSRGSVNSN